METLWLGRESLRHNTVSEILFLCQQRLTSNTVMSMLPQMGPLTIWCMPLAKMQTFRLAQSLLLMGSINSSSASVDLLSICLTVPVSGLCPAISPLHLDYIGHFVKFVTHSGPRTAASSLQLVYMLSIQRLLHPYQFLSFGFPRLFKFLAPF